MPGWRDHGTCATRPEMPPGVGTPRQDVWNRTIFSTRATGGPTGWRPLPQHPYSRLAESELGRLNLASLRFRCADEQELKSQPRHSHWRRPRSVAALDPAMRVPRLFAAIGASIPTSFGTCRGRLQLPFHRREPVAPHAWRLRLPKRMRAIAGRVCATWTSIFMRAHPTFSRGYSRPPFLRFGSGGWRDVRSDCTVAAGTTRDHRGVVGVSLDPALRRGFARPRRPRHIRVKAGSAPA